MSKVKENIKKMNDLILKRSKLKGKRKEYQKLNAKVQYYRQWLRKHGAEPLLKQTREQPAITGFVASLPSPNFADIILDRAIRCANADDMESCKALLKTYEIIKTEKSA